MQAIYRYNIFDRQDLPIQTESRDMKYCHSCGAKLPDDAQFCTSCGTKQHTYAEPSTPEPESPAPESPAPAVDSISAPTAQPKENWFKRAKGKVTAFENKHNIIVNAIMLACAFIVALVALFAPIKVETYDRGLSYYEINDDTTVTTCATVDQSIFQILGSVFYFNASERTRNEVAEDYQAARDKANKAFNKWINTHSGASEEEVYNKRVEFTTKYMSDVNYLGIYMMDMTEENMLSYRGVYLNVLLTAFFGWAVAILAIIMAVTSIVQLVFAIINMAKKKPQTKLYKYFTKMLGLSTAGLAVLCCAPLLKAGGSMLAIAILIGLVFLACGVIDSLLKGTNFMLVIKRGVCALVALIGYFVLFTEVFAVMSRSMSSQSNVPSGYGLYRLLEMVIFSTEIPDSTGMQAMTESAAVGFVMYLLVAVFLVTFAGEVFKRSLRRLAFGDEAKKTKYSGMALTTAIFATVIIILGFAAVVEGTKWLCRGSIWVCMLFMLGVFIFGKVFLPNDKIKGKEQPVQELPPQQEPPIQNNLMQQTQNTYKPFM